MLQFRELSLAGVTTLLCDADGNLFPSEDPAFDAAATVMNRMLESLGVDAHYCGPTLRRTATGRNFRSIVEELARERGVAIDEPLLDAWVEEEVAVVTEHLGGVLRPDAHVIEALDVLQRTFRLAVVSSSALRRLAVCFTATGLDRLFPHERRFSAQDSLPFPTSKPDPAVYVFAGTRLGIGSGEGLAIEDASSGVASARAAGFEAIGNVLFVAPEERDERIEELRAAGAGAVVQDWAEVVDLLAECPVAGESVA
ncbi:HAD family hydrolase [Pedococcus sp. 5OH_020]|uniref:HAD family hydrolase n=1 Tax=Pedococcus sp. 5OH_020 TaxID=2989814 RepID=UPI0022E99949|nr:HAD family phosphatase [Pedococcus sp. 5OH_020]